MAMHRRSILTLTILVTIHILFAAKDSLQKSTAQSVGSDTSVAAGTVDTVHHDSAVTGTAKQDIEVSGTVLKKDSVREDTARILPYDTSAGTVHNVFSDSTAMPKKALQQIVRNVRNGLKKLIRYAAHLILLILSCGIILFTIFYFRKQADNRRFMTSTRLSVMDREVQLACKFIESNYADPALSVETICTTLVTGTAFLEALFDRELGMSVSDFITHVRMNRVKQILEKNTFLSDEDIMPLVGFTDKELFLQKFKENTGVAFKEYQDTLFKMHDL